MINVNVFNDPDVLHLILINPLEQGRSYIGGNDQ